MKLRLKEDPKEWRKAGCFGALGFALLSSLLYWRQVLPLTAWVVTISLLAGVAVSAVLCPRWFRGYYRFGSRMAFLVTQFAGYAALTILFLLVIVPMGLILRLLGKDLLRLKRARSETFWVPARPVSKLENMF